MYFDSSQTQTLPENKIEVCTSLKTCMHRSDCKQQLYSTTNLAFLNSDCRCIQGNGVSCYWYLRCRGVSSVLLLAISLTGFIIFHFTVTYKAFEGACCAEIIKTSIMDGFGERYARFIYFDFGSVALIFLSQSEKRRAIKLMLLVYFVDLSNKVVFHTWPLSVTVQTHQFFMNRLARSPLIVAHKIQRLISHRCEHRKHTVAQTWIESLQLQRSKNQ